MIINEYCVKKDLNGHDYIYIVNPIVNPDNYGERAWYIHFYYLVFSIKDIIPDMENFYYDDNEYYGFSLEHKCFDRTGNGFSINTSYGKVEITQDTLCVDDNTELLNKILILLDHSEYFTRVEE